MASPRTLGSSSVRRRLEGFSSASLPVKTTWVSRSPLGQVRSQAPFLLSALPPCACR
ncbi:MAG: hypothetical protein KatS3mg082_2814 [Nitrospiraceae bacterium]|nr:MAG: hypothetical protein KatS3mg082_2814 [Nitrospiraceae bacterium]